MAKKLSKILNKVNNMLEKFSKKAMADADEGAEVVVTSSTGLSTPGSSLSVSLNGVVDAVGTDTTASGSVDATVKDLPKFDVAKGSLTVSGAATGGAAFVTADAQLDVSGADFVVSFTRTVTGDNFQFSKVSFIAIDLPNFTPTGGSVVVSLSSNLTVSGSTTVPPGNLATAEFDVVAEGPLATADVVVDTLVFENALSSAMIDAQLGVA